MVEIELAQIEHCGFPGRCCLDELGRRHRTGPSVRRMPESDTLQTGTVPMDAMLGHAFVIAILVERI
jgi:hypothetical protein